MEQISSQILVVDDDENDFFFIERAFKQNRISNPLFHARNGEVAVEYLKGQGEYIDRQKYPLPFLMLLDINMPRMNGFEVIQWVRKSPGIKRIPIVVFTSSKESPDIDKAYELGANTYLVKPIESDNLIEMVNTLNLYWQILAERPSLQS